MFHMVQYLKIILWYFIQFKAIWKMRALVNQHNSFPTSIIFSSYSYSYVIILTKLNVIWKIVSSYLYFFCFFCLLSTKSFIIFLIFYYVFLTLSILPRFDFVCYTPYIVQVHVFKFVKTLVFHGYVFTLF